MFQVTICAPIVSPEVQGAVAHPVGEGGGDGGPPVPPVPHLPLPEGQVMLGPGSGHHHNTGPGVCVS